MATFKINPVKVTHIKPKPARTLALKSLKPAGVRSGAAIGAATGAAAKPKLTTKQPTKPLQPLVPQPQQPAVKAAAPVMPQVSYDPGTDPTLNKLQALSQLGRENARAEATNLRQQLAIKYGDRALAQQFGGDVVARAAADNPNSIAAQLTRSYQQGQRDLEQNLNEANLYYSGARINRLGELAQDYGTQQAQAAGELQSSLANIDTNLAAALAEADRQDADALQKASLAQMLASIEAGGVPVPEPEGPNIIREYGPPVRPTSGVSSAGPKTITKPKPKPAAKAKAAPRKAAKTLARKAVR